MLLLKCADSVVKNWDLSKSKMLIKLIGAKSLFEGAPVSGKII